MSDLKEYTLTVGGVETTVQLSEADAKRYGKAAVESGGKAAATPANKSRTAADK